MFRNGLSGFMSHMPPVTKNLIIINVLIWAIEAIVPKFGDTLIKVLGLHFVGANDFNPIQIVTYMFLHATNNPWHLLFNMFSLWMFGSILERVWGSKRYFIFYFVCGIVAAFVQEIVWASTWMHDFISRYATVTGLSFENAKEVIMQAANSGDPNFLRDLGFIKSSMVTIGASGAIYGLLLGYAFVFPNQPLYLFFIPIPIKAKYMMIGYAAIEFFLGFKPIAGDTVAHFAHLGGALFGLFILLYWKKKGLLRGNSFY